MTEEPSGLGKVTVIQIFVVMVVVKIAVNELFPIALLLTPLLVALLLPLLIALTLLTLLLLLLVVALAALLPK